MHRPGWTPSIVPNGNGQAYLVADDFVKLGRACQEVDYETSDLQTGIQDVLTGPYNAPIRIIAALNISVRCPEDVYEGATHELRCDLHRDIPFFLKDINEHIEGRYRDVQLPLPMHLTV